MAKKIHAIVTASAPELAAEDVVRDARVREGTAASSASSRARTSSRRRYATFGFDDAANLDDGAMWPTSFALTKLAAADEAKIAKLVKKAAS